MGKIFTFLFLCITFFCNAQLEQTGRYEVEQRPRENNYMLLSADEFGLVLFKEKIKRAKGNNYIWDIKMLNTSLEEQWSREIIVDKKFYFTGYDYRNARLYLMFKKSASRKPDFNIIVVDLTNGVDNRYDVNNVMPIQLEDFLIISNNAVFAGYVNSRPTVFTFDFAEEKVKVLPGFYNKVSHFVDIHIDEALNAYNVLLSERDENNDYVLTIKSFDEKGNMISDQMIKADPNHRIITGKSASFYNDQLKVVGTYGQSTDFAQGVFFASLDPDGKQSIKYYPFTQLKNYFGYLPEAREERIKAKISRKKAKGKNFKVSSRMAIHELIREGNTYVMLGEVYDIMYEPTYYSRFNSPYWYNSFNYGYRGYSTRRHKNPYEDNIYGFEYTHAVVIGFNDNGDLIWDSSMRIEDIELPFLEQVVNMNTAGGQIALLYKYDTELRSKVLSEDYKMEEYQTDSLMLMNPTDEIRYNDKDFGGLSYWYGDYFFTWGYQKIGTRHMGQRKREVFYINKLRFK